MQDFKYVNLNPMGLNESDCVTRAIALVSKRDYFDIRRKLNLVSELLECEELCPCCYFHLLDYVFCYERVNCRDLTVGEFALQHPRGIYLIRMEGHISVIIDGKVNDTWRCHDKIATDCWFIEN